MKEKKMKKEQIIPIFFAADKNYIPFLSVSLDSLKENASKSYRYEIYILNTDIDEKTAEPVKKFEDENFGVHFIDVSERLEEVKNSLQLRDYYTGATYYRIFIANMFPEYEKALYIDSDTIVLGDVSELFHTELKSNLIGAIPDEAVAVVPEFRLYTKETLGVEAEKYFNAGVILMNLKEFRKSNFYGKFCGLLKTYKFCVAQDQDYLNVLCKDKIVFVGNEWNKMPIGGASATPKLIHYNLTMKPWHYENILFKEHFWHYAKRSEYYERILGELRAYSAEKKQKDADSEVALKALAVEEAKREDNYFKRFGK